MKGKRWKKILLWTLSVLVVLGVGGLFAANYAIDKVMNSIADGFDLEEDDPADTGTPSAPAASASPDVAGEGGSVPGNSAAPAEGSTPTSSEGGAGQGQKPAASSTDTDGAGKQTTAPDSGKTSPPAKDGYTAEVPLDKAKDIKENVTVKDKTNVASILLGQLSMSDINRLQDLAKGGLTIEEKREARSILLSKVSEEEYNQLSQIAKKYGVSQGKTRDQVLQEEKGSE